MVLVIQVLEDQRLKVQLTKVLTQSDPFTVGYSNTDNDKTGASDREVTSYAVSYTVSDDLSVSYGQETFDTAGQSVDEEFESYKRFLHYWWNDINCII